MEHIGFKEALIHWIDLIVQQIIPLANAMIHVFTGALIFWIGSRLGGHKHG